MCTWKTSQHTSVELHRLTVQIQRIIKLNCFWKLKVRFASIAHFFVKKYRIYCQNYRDEKGFGSSFIYNISLLLIITVKTSSFFFFSIDLPTANRTVKKQTKSTSNPKAAKGYTCKQYTRQHTHCSSNFDLFMSFTNRLCISQFHLRPASPPPPHPLPGWPPGISIFFALDDKFPGVGTLELSNPSGCERKKRANTPSSVNTATFFIDRTVK